MTKSKTRIILTSMASMILLFQSACSVGQPALPAPDISRSITGQDKSNSSQQTESPHSKSQAPTELPGKIGSIIKHAIIVYSKMGNLWASTESGLTQLTSTGIDSHPKLSNNGEWVAFLRGEELWLLDLAGRHPRKLFGKPGLHPSIYFFDLRGDSIYFTTSRDDNNPLNDLNQVNVVNGTMKTLIEPGLSGEFTPSPNWQTFALVQPGKIFTYSIITGERKLVYQYKTDFQSLDYIPPIVWLTDNTGFKTVIPGINGKPARFIYIPVSGGPSAQLAEFISVPVSESKFSISPDGSRVIYLKKRGDELEVHVIDASTADRAYLKNPAGKIGIVGWSPDSKYLLFWMNDIGSVWMSNGETVIALSDGARASDLDWITPKEYVFLTDSELRIRSWDQPSILIDTKVEPVFDAIPYPSPK